MQVPRVAGFYELHVRLRTDGGGSSEPILGSPFGVETMPGETFARESEALGGHGNCGPELAPCPGTDYGVSGHNSTFEIRAYDAHKNRRRVGGWWVRTAVRKFCAHNNDIPYPETVVRLHCCRDEEHRRRQTTEGGKV